MRLISLLLILALLSCSGKDNIPKGILKPSQMEPVFWDYMRADVYTSEFYKGDSTNDATLQNLKMQETIFKKYSVSREQFEKSLSYYLNHPEILSPLADSLLAHHPEEVLNKFEKKILPGTGKRIVKPLGIQANE